MKINLLMIIGCLSLLNTGYGQRLSKSTVDEFTKASVKETTWEPFTKTNHLRSFIRMRKVDSAIIMEIKFSAGGSVTSMREGASIMLMHEDGSITTLKNSKFELSCTGCGANGLAFSSWQGLNIETEIGESEASALVSQPIKKIRLYLSNGYVEEEVNKKQSDLLQKELELIGIQK